MSCWRSAGCHSPGNALETNVACPRPAWDPAVDVTGPRLARSAYKRQGAGLSGEEGTGLLRDWEIMRFCLTPYKPNVLPVISAGGGVVAEAPHLRLHFASLGTPPPGFSSIITMNRFIGVVNSIPFLPSRRCANLPSYKVGWIQRCRPQYALRGRTLFLAFSPNLTPFLLCLSLMFFVFPSFHLSFRIDVAHGLLQGRYFKVELYA